MHNRDVNINILCARVTIYDADAEVDADTDTVFDVDAVILVEWMWVEMEENGVEFECSIVYCYWMMVMAR